MQSRRATRHHVRFDLADTIDFFVDHTVPGFSAGTGRGASSGALIHNNGEIFIIRNRGREVCSSICTAFLFRIQ